MLQIAKNDECVTLDTIRVCEINHTIVQMFEHMFENPKHSCVGLFPIVKQWSLHFKLNFIFFLNVMCIYQVNLHLDNLKCSV